MWILAIKSLLLSTICQFPITFCFLSVPLCYPVTACTYLSLVVQFLPRFCPHSFSTRQGSLTHLSPLLSVHPLIYAEREGIHQQKAVESYCAGGRRRVEDQTMLARYSMKALCLSLSHRFFPPSSFTKSLHLLHPSTSSLAPFAFSVSRDVSLPSLNSPATL